MLIEFFFLTWNLVTIGPVALEERLETVKICAAKNDIDSLLLQIIMYSLRQL